MRRSTIALMLAENRFRNEQDSYMKRSAHHSDGTLRAQELARSTCRANGIAKRLRELLRLSEQPRCLGDRYSVAITHGVRAACPESQPV